MDMAKFVTLMRESEAREWAALEAISSLGIADTEPYPEALANIVRAEIQTQEMLMAEYGLTPQEAMRLVHA